MNRAKMPEGFQCPACGVPVTNVELRVERTPSGYGLLLEDCGHVATLEVLRQLWGIDIPEPDVNRVTH